MAQLIRLTKDHGGKDVLVTLRANSRKGDPWPFRVIVEWEGYGARPTDRGVATRAEAVKVYREAMGYECTHSTRGRACRHFTEAARAHVA